RKSRSMVSSMSDFLMTLRPFFFLGAPSPAAGSALGAGSAAPRTAGDGAGAVGRRRSILPRTLTPRISSKPGGGGAGTGPGAGRATAGRPAGTVADALGAAGSGAPAAGVGGSARSAAAGTGAAGAVAARGGAASVAGGGGSTAAGGTSVSGGGTLASRSSAGGTSLTTLS